MACDGPSKDFAYKQGEEVFEKVLAMLDKEYFVREPHIYPDVDIEGNTPLGNRIAKVLVSRSKCDVAEWEENTEKLKHLIQEIVWADHANGF